MATAKVFWSGRSQAVRLPKEFRVDGDEVRIHRQGNRDHFGANTKRLGVAGRLVERSTGSFDEDFIKAVNEEELPMQERPELDETFK